MAIREKLNSSTKVFCYSKLQSEIASFFFDKKHMVNSVLLMPKIMNESHMAYQFLSKNKIYKPSDFKIYSPENSKIPISDWYQGTINSIDFIKKKIDKSDISAPIIEVLKRPTISLFVKNFSKYRNNHLNFQVRQTRDLNKIYELFKFLNKQKINVLVLGTKKDHFIQILESGKIMRNYDNIYLFKDLSKKFSIADQAFSAFNSIGYVGSATGTMGFFGLFNKKVILIDAVSYYADKYWSNFTFLYKKIFNKKNKTLKVFSWKKYYDPNEVEIIENSYDEIRFAIEKKILNKNGI